MDTFKALQKALLKRAVGFTYKEQILEYEMVSQELKGKQAVISKQAETQLPKDLGDINASALPNKTYQQTQGFSQTQTDQQSQRNLSTKGLSTSLVPAQGSLQTQIAVQTLGALPVGNELLIHEADEEAYANGTLFSKTQNGGVQCAQLAKRGRGRPKGSTNKKVFQLSKKKIVSHYVPPDLVALKMLLEQQKMQETETLTDAALLKLKEEIDAQLEKGEYKHDS